MRPGTSDCGGRGRAAPMAGLALLMLVLGAAPVAAQSASPLGGVFVWAGRTPTRDGLRVGQVLEVTPDGPAARAGLVAGDTLLAIGGVTLTDPAALARSLEQAPADASCWITRARAAGPVPDSARGSVRDSVEAWLAPLALRLGATVTTAGVGRTSSAVVDDSVSVTVSVSEWSGLTFVAVRLDHRGRGRLDFGPDSVLVLDGTHRVVRPVSSARALSVRYATPETRQVASWVAAMVGDERSATTAAMEHDELRQVEIPPGAHALGLLYFTVERMESPVEVRVRTTSREYVFTFDRVF
jgi:hypothetical protein